MGGNVLRTYVYDYNTDDPSYSQYALGRLAEIKYPAITYQTSPGAHDSTTMFTDMFSYHQAGAVVGKRLRVAKTNPYFSGGQWHSQPGQGDLNMTYAYDNEGKPTQITYPTESGPFTPTYNYTYDAMSRLTGMTDNNGTAAGNVSYGAANQLLSINYYGATETRSYNNVTLQMTNITATVQGGGGINVTYNYPTGSNNGKITSMTDNISAETITYQYDSLNRLISAAGSGWSQTMTYDGFGNLIARAGAQPMNTAADPNTNRLTGYSYDANGNQLSNSATYDAENRIAQANGGLIMYGYDAQNKRIWQGTCTLGINCAQGVINVDTVTMFGADGRQAGTFAPQVTWTNNQTQVAITFVVVSRRAYFGGKLVGQFNGSYMQSAVQDRLGSVGKYYPYGEERNSPPLINDQVKFATYTRDSGTGLDYADQRYYASTFGRFMTPDPYKATEKGKNPANPLSWNRYAYVSDDPVSFNDPWGLTTCTPGGGIGGYCYDSVTVDGDTGGVIWSDTGMNVPPFVLLGGQGGCNDIFCNTMNQYQDAIGSINPCPHGQVQFAYGCDVPLSPTGLQIMAMVDQALQTQLREAALIGLSTYAGLAIGGLVDAIVASEVATTGGSFFENTTVSESVLKKMAKDLFDGGGFHAFPSSVTAFEDAGTITTSVSADGSIYTQLNISGSYLSPNGTWYNGTFEFGKDASNTITHWFFRPNP